jgi:hypothetical protein
MSSTITIISEQEVDPNSLGLYTKLPLPDFAIQALKDHGFDYYQKSGDPSSSKLNSEQNQRQLKLSSHIKCVSQHINHDGPIIRPRGTI